MVVHKPVVLCSNTPCPCRPSPVLQVAAIGSAMVKVGLGPHARVGVYGANSPQWMIAMQVRSKLPGFWVAAAGAGGAAAGSRLCRSHCGNVQNCD